MYIAHNICPKNIDDNKVKKTLRENLLNLNICYDTFKANILVPSI